MSGSISSRILRGQRISDFVNLFFMNIFPFHDRFSKIKASRLPPSLVDLSLLVILTLVLLESLYSRDDELLLLGTPPVPLSASRLQELSLSILCLDENVNIVNIVTLPPTICVEISRVTEERDMLVLMFRFPDIQNRDVHTGYRHNSVP